MQLLCTTGDFVFKRVFDSAVRGPVSLILRAWFARLKYLMLTVLTDEKGALFLLNAKFYVLVLYKEK